MKTYEPIDFSDLEPIIIPVIGPDKNRYVLCQATGQAGVIYNNAKARTLRFGPDGNPSGTTGLGEVEPLLVSLCLFSSDSNGQPQQPVPLSTVKAWPYPVQKKLHDIAKEISELDDPEDLDSLIKRRDGLNQKIADLQNDEGSVKNLQEDTPDGSE